MADHEQFRSLPGTYIHDPIDENVESPPTPPAEQPRQNRDRTCRICLSGVEDGIAHQAELMEGRLISPCRCRGTMKFVHLSCLNTWRYSSPNSKSVYQCDQCGYKYNFARTQYAAIVGSLYVRLVCTVTSFILAVFLSGFIFKLILYLTGASLPFTRISSILDLLFGIDPVDEMSSIDLDTWGYRPPRTLKEVFFTGIGDAAHWALGVVGLALWGFITLMTGMGALGINIRFTPRRRRADGERRRGGTFGGIMWGIIILIGTARMLKAIYNAVDAWIQRYQVKLETAILEVDPDGE